MAVLTLQSKGTTGGDNNLIDGGFADLNYGIRQYIQTGRDAGNIYKALLRFDLSALPASAFIVSAVLTIHTTGQFSATGRSFAPYRGLTQWYEGDKDNAVPTISASTWSKRNYPFNVSWSGSIAGGQSGVDYVASPSGETITINTANAFYSFIVTADVQLWANGTVNNGWWLLATTADVDSRKDFSAFDASTPSQRPALVITYTTSQAAAPTARFAVAGRAGPTVVKGAIVRAPTANFSVGATTGPSLIKIGYTITPAPAMAVGETISATAIKSSIAKSPTPAFVRGSTVSPPTIIQTSTVIEPAPAEARGETTLSAALMDLSISPTTPANAVSTTVNPTVAIGGMTFPGGAASAVGSTPTPQVNVKLTGVANTRGSTVNPTTLRGGGPDAPSTASAVGSTQAAASLVDLTLRPSAATVVGETVGKASAARIVPIVCTPDPLLYITNGTIKTSGQLNRLSLLTNGFLLNDWKPNVSQYKDGGVWSDSALAEGRTLARRSFANGLEVMDLRGSGRDQDAMIAFVQELFAWQEMAANYWVSDWGIQPVYIVAKAAKETNPRYALIKAMSVPELTNPFSQPFYSRSMRSGIDPFTLRIERGPWLSTPPGLGDGVNLSNIRSWTIQGWQVSNTTGGGDATITGAVLCFVQLASGDILAGTNDQAKIYRSTDNGATWIMVAKLGTGTDAVNAMVVTGVGNVFAATTGTVATRGIWRSTNNGVTWLKNVNDPTGQGYWDISYSRQNSTLAAGGGSSVAEQNNILFSSSEGQFWSIPLNKANAYGVIAVEAQSEPVLATQYPGEPAGDAFAIAGAHFIGYDSYYTVLGAGYLQSNGQWNSYAPGTGLMGNGGLDLAVFLHKNPAGSYYRKVLWAVRSALDVTDTEIWQWPNPAGGWNAGKLVTIDNKIFNVLYVDPVAYTAIPTLRTIWAGANGELYVSYNNGLTWTLATSAPVNQIRAIIRTTAGTLLTGGDSGEIFNYSGASGSTGGGVGAVDENGRPTNSTQPVGGTTVVNSYPLGMEETSEDSVYTSNKSSFNNITHVLHYNGSTYTELQFATLPPYSLLGTTAVVNKAAYFGSKTSDTNVPGGAFSSVIFDISTIAENITVVWEYWSGAAWSTLTVQDSSNGFRLLGINSVHWKIPTNWATTTVNGVVGYWVRARTSAVAANPVTPIHDSYYHRYIYTANLPYVEVSIAGVTGDLPANAQIRWHNRAENILSFFDLEIDRMVCGLRSVARGSYFNAYLNISDVQIPYGFTITHDVDSSYGASVRAPTNRALTISYASAGRLNTWNDLANFYLSTTIARDYYGTYRAFVRCNKSGSGTNNWKVRIRNCFGTGGGDSFTKAVFPSTAHDWEVLDLGQVSIPSSQAAAISGNLSDEICIAVQGYCTATGIALVLYDLILIPMDEWGIDSRSPQPASVIRAKVKGGNYLDIDSITSPKTLISSINRNPSDQIVARYQATTNGPAMLQTRRQQRFWFLTMSYQDYWQSYPEASGSVQVFKQQKYLYARGVS